MHPLSTMAKSLISSLMSLAVIVMMLMTTAVQPVLAADAVNEQVESLNTALADPELITDVEISEIALGGVGFDSAHTAPTDLINDGEGPVSVHVEDPLAAALPQGGPPAARAVLPPLDSAEADQLVSNLTRDGYTYTDMSSHQYETTLTRTSERLRGLNKDQLAAAGIIVSDTDTVRENVDYYRFTNEATGDMQVLMVAQLVGADGVTPVGTKKSTVVPESGWWENTKNWVTDHPIAWVKDHPIAWAKDHPTITNAIIIAVIILAIILVAWWFWPAASTGILVGASSGAGFGGGTAVANGIGSSTMVIVPAAEASASASSLLPAAVGVLGGVAAQQAATVWALPMELNAAVNQELAAHPPIHPPMSDSPPEQKESPSVEIPQINTGAPVTGSGREVSVFK